MSAAAPFKPGELLTIAGRRCTFLNRVPATEPEAQDIYQFRDEGDHAIFRLTRTEFYAHFNAGEVVWIDRLAHVEDAIVRSPDDEADPTVGSSRSYPRQVRRWFCEQFDAAPTPVSKADIPLRNWIGDVAPHCPEALASLPSAGALRSWLRVRGMPGDRMPRYMGDRRRAVSKPRLAPEIEPMLAAAAREFWADRKVKVKDVWAELIVAVNAKNRDRAAFNLPPLSRPALSTVRRRLTRHADYDRTRRRHGAKIAQQFLPIRGSLETSRILETVIVDSTILDCHLIDDVTYLPVGRPWLTVAIDVYSRCILAAHATFTPPSVQTLSATVLQACQEKSELAQRYPDVPHVWPAFGRPETLLVDNDWSQSGGSFRDACADLGISVVWAPVATPQYKGVGERFFRTLNEQLTHKLPGAVPGSPRQLRQLGIEPVAEATLLLSEFQELLYQYVVEVYGRTFHTGLRGVPEQVWRADEKRRGIPHVSDLASLRLALGVVVGPLELTRKGVQLNHLTYCSDAVFDLLNDLLPRAPKRGKRAGSVSVKVTYWPEDLSKIAVWNDVRKEYVEVACTQPRYSRGLSEHLHGRLKEFARETGLAFSSEEERCRALTALNAKIKAKANHRLLGERKRAVRLRKVDTATDSQSAGSDERVTTPIETVSNRADGEPMRGPVRAPKPASKTPKAKASPVQPGSPVAAVQDENPLAGVDWAQLLS